MSDVKAVKEYSVRLTEKEMAAIAKCMASYFQRLTQAKQTIPVEVAENVHTALHKIKAAADGAIILTLEPQ